METGACFHTVGLCFYTIAEQIAQNCSVRGTVWIGTLGEANGGQAGQGGQSDGDEQMRNSDKHGWFGV